MFHTVAGLPAFPLFRTISNSKLKTKHPFQQNRTVESSFSLLFSTSQFPTSQLLSSDNTKRTMDGDELPCPSPSPYHLSSSSTLLKDISNFKTPKRPPLSLNPQQQSPSTQFFTASKQSTLPRRLKKPSASASASASATAARRKLKAFQVEQSQSSRKAQIRKEQSLKSLAKSLTVWLNFLLESPASCGCHVSFPDAPPSTTTTGKRNTAPRISVGVDSAWRTPKRQRKTGKENAPLPAAENSLRDSLKDVCSFDDLKQRMGVYLSLGTCEDIFRVMNQVTKVCFLILKTHFELAANWFELSCSVHFPCYCFLFLRQLTREG